MAILWGKTKNFPVPREQPGMCPTGDAGHGTARRHGTGLIARTL